MESMRRRLDSQDPTPPGDALTPLERFLQGPRALAPSGDPHFCPSVLETENVDVHLRAQALVGRAFAHGRANDFHDAIADCNMLLQMADAPFDQRAQAHCLRGWYFGMTSQPRQALADFSNILKMHEVAPSLKSGALYGRRSLLRDSASAKTPLWTAPLSFK